jgi:hypothetical protein
LSWSQQMCSRFAGRHRSLHYYWLLRVLKRKRRGIAFPASALITQVAVEAVRRRIKPCHSGLAFASLTRHMPDMLADREYAHDLALAGNWRATLAVPMLHEGKAVGAISIGKAEIGPFSER